VHFQAPARTGGYGDVDGLKRLTSRSLGNFGLAEINPKGDRGKTPKARRTGLVALIPVRGTGRRAPPSKEQVSLPVTWPGQAA
jgi:hypothetical protein